VSGSGSGTGISVTDGYGSGTMVNVGNGQGSGTNVVVGDGHVSGADIAGDNGSISPPTSGRLHAPPLSRNHCLCCSNKEEEEDIAGDNGETRHVPRLLVIDHFLRGWRLMKKDTMQASCPGRT